MFKGEYTALDFFGISIILAVCLTLVYFFHFDVFLSSDSAWASITMSKLLEGSPQELYKMPGHGRFYSFGYQLLNYFIMKALGVGTGGRLMETLNLVNGLFFSMNIILIYILLREISFSRVLSFGLSLLYFFIPTIFQMSLYTNPITFSFLFFLLSNIFFAAYLKKSKKADLFLSGLFFILSILIRLETLIFYVSFIALTIILGSSIRRTGFLLAMNTLLSFIIILPLVISLRLFTAKMDIDFIFSVFDAFKRIRFDLIGLGKLTFSIGIGLFAVFLFSLFRNLYMKRFKLSLAIIIWMLPVILYAAIIYYADFTRAGSPTYLALIIALGFFLKDFNRRRQTASLVAIYILHFSCMPLSYYIVKKFYPLKRHYRTQERILIEYVPIGNIFVNAYTLRKEKRIVWERAKCIVAGNAKVIIISNNTNRIPYYFFLYHFFNGAKMEEFQHGKSYWPCGDKEFIFIDIVSDYDVNIIKEVMRDLRFSDFSIHFTPFLPERVPSLYMEIRDICEKEGRKLI